jgi:penicillin-binding protein 1B
MKKSQGMKMNENENAPLWTREGMCIIKPMSIESIRSWIENVVRKWPRPKSRREWVDLTLLGLCVFFILYLGVLYFIVTDRFEGKRWRFPSKVYSDSYILYPGQEIAGIHLLDRIERLGYHPVDGEPERPGQYRLEADRLDLYLNDFAYPDHRFNGELVRLGLSNGRIEEITDLNQKADLALAELEPELIAAYYDKEWEERDLVRLNELPPHLVDTILTIEDVRFYQHFGVDPRSIARAIWVDLKNRAIVQGGSTVTQQLVKNFYLTKERSLIRKFNELFMALLLEVRYSKQEILEAYLNEIYFGQSGTMGIFGVGEAARFYFGKRPEQLTLGESALLAGMIKSPNAFSPFNNPERARARKVLVLSRLLSLGKISAPEYLDALGEPLPTRHPVARKRVAPYFVDFVRQQLTEHYSARVLNSEGLRVFTTLDMQLQQEAEESLAHGLDRLERSYPDLQRKDPMEKLQGCLIAMQPQTGQIKAMVGGRDYKTSQFNRAAQAMRQPGSLFKPFVYAAALVNGETPEGAPYTPVTRIDDAPVILSTSKNVWIPQNYDKNYHGPVTLRTALEQSLNVATIRLAQQVGTRRVIEMARALGIRTPLQDVPSIALGTSEVTPLEIASAYGAIANGGMRTEPLAIKEVVDADGRVLERRTLEMTQVLTPQQAFLLTHLLQGVVDRGTAGGVRAMGFTRPAAGKTGTTSHYNDAWFSGFTPELLSLVWVGFDQPQPAPPGSEDSLDLPDEDEGARMTGAAAALPIWTEFMTAATAGLPETRFTTPPGIVFEKVDPATGLIANSRCPGGIREAFIEGTQPTQSCGGSVMAEGFFQRLKHWMRLE